MANQRDPRRKPWRRSKGGKNGNLFGTAGNDCLQLKRAADFFHSVDIILETASGRHLREMLYEKWPGPMLFHIASDDLDIWRERQCFDNGLAEISSCRRDQHT